VLLAGELVSGGKQDRVIARIASLASLWRAAPAERFLRGAWAVASGSQFNEANTIVHQACANKPR